MTGSQPELQVITIHAGMSLAYLIVGQMGVVLVDSGSPGNAHLILREMHKLGRENLRLIFITHANFDHYGSAAALRQMTGAPLAAHRADAVYLQRGLTPIGSTRGRGRLISPFLGLVDQFVPTEAAPPDVLLEDGSELHDFGLDARVVHTPGHTPGSCCLLVEGRLAFVGDLVTGGRRPHAQRYFAVDWSQLPASLKRVQALHPEWVYPGHGRRPLSGAEFQAI